MKIRTNNDICIDFGKAKMHNFYRIDQKVKAAMLLEKFALLALLMSVVIMHPNSPLWAKILAGTGIVETAITGMNFYLRHKDEKKSTELFHGAQKAKDDVMDNIKKRKARSTLPPQKNHRPSLTAKYPPQKNTLIY